MKSTTARKRSLSLVLSNLESLSPILSGSPLHPADDEVRKLREYFQYFALLHLRRRSAVMLGRSGFRDPDHSPFIDKLQEVWTVLCDGRVDAQIGAPTHPKDDQVDVFAARLPYDRLPGISPSGSTGGDWKESGAEVIEGSLVHIQEPMVRYSAGDRVHCLHDRTIRHRGQSVRGRCAYYGERTAPFKGATKGC